MRNKLFYMLAAAGIGYVAIIYNSKGFLMLFGAAVLLPPFLLCMLWYAGKRMECELLFSPYPEEDGRYRVSLLVSNHSPFYLAEVRAKIALKPLEDSKTAPFGRKLAGHRRKVFTVPFHYAQPVAERAAWPSILWKSETFTVSISGRAGAGEKVKLVGTAGNLDFGLWQAECRFLACYDCLGLFSRKKKVKQKKQVMIFPACYETNIQAGIRTRLFLADGEVYHPQTKGDDPAEVLNLRGYQKGDRLNRIHWKLSARNEELIVADMSMPIGCNVALFLDACTDAMAQEARRTYWEVVNTVSQGLLTQECFHYLVWYNEREQRLHRRAVRDFQDLTDFWSEILKYRMGRCSFSKEYGQEFRGESYVTGIVWNQELELYCNGEFLVKVEPGRVKEQMLELELIV